jgi:hypothetical protein
MLGACGQTADHPTNTSAGAAGSAGASVETHGRGAAGASGALTGGGGNGAESVAGGAAAGAGGIATSGSASGASGSASAGASGRPGGGGQSGNAGAGGASCNPSLGEALQFDGTVVDLMSGDLGSDLPSGDTPRTVELWAKFLGAQSWKPEGSILETGLEHPPKGGGNRVFGLDLSGYSGGTAEFGPYTSGYSDNNHPNGVYVANMPETGWLHLAWSYTGNHGALSFTVNGTEYPVITLSGLPTLDVTTGFVTLAASQTFGTLGWSGVMDELRLWSVAKTPAQIKSGMNVLLKGTEPGLVAYYPFNEGAGAFTDDVSRKPSHRLSACGAIGPACPAANTQNPLWVDSDIPGSFSCAP